VRKPASKFAFRFQTCTAYSAGAKMDATDDGGVTPLMLACSGGHIAVVRVGPFTFVAVKTHSVDDTGTRFHVITNLTPGSANPTRRWRCCSRRRRTCRSRRRTERRRCSARHVWGRVVHSAPPGVATWWLHGGYMVATWWLHGGYMVSAWCLHGVCMVSTWTIPAVIIN
jgi:hypothetical protein